MQYSDGTLAGGGKLNTTYQDGTAKMPFRADIEGLRALAVAVVVAFHFGVTGLSGGFVGVDIFFAISGYLITGLIAKEVETTRHFRFAAFYARRVRRLLPAILFMLVGTLLFAPLVLSVVERQDLARASIATSLYFSNFHFMWQKFNYFAPDADKNALLHTWSLAVEEQFYLVWPVLLLLVLKFLRTTKQRLAGLGFIAVLSFAICIWLSHHFQPFAFFSLPSRAWEFSVGGIAAMLPSNPILVNRRISCLISAGGFVVVIASTILLDPQAVFPGWRAFPPVFGTAAILYAGTVSPIALFETIPARFIGKLSYAIYLWHWPIIIFATILFPAISFVGKTVCLTLTIGMATTSFWLLERPIRANRWLVTRPWASLLFATILSVVGVAGGYLASAAAKNALHTPRQMQIEEAVARQPVYATNPACRKRVADSNSDPCVFGDPKALGTVVLFGDSHAGQWSTALLSIVAAKHWRLVVFVKPSCAAANVPVFYPPLKRWFVECAAWRDGAIDKIVRLHPNLVVMSEFSAAYVGPVEGMLGRPTIARGQYLKGLQETLTRLKGIRVMVIADTPHMGVNVPNCLGRPRYIGEARSCDRSRAATIDSTLGDAEKSLIGSVAHARYVDLNNLFCGQIVCTAERDGTILYHDNNHISEAAAIRFRPTLEKAIASR